MMALCLSYMYMKIVHKLPMTYRLLLVILFAVFTSCDRGPVPDSSWLPEMVDVSVEPGVYGAVLSAKVKGEFQYGCEYGFYYGTTETDLQKIQSPCQDGVVSTTLTDLLPDTKYFFKAYVTNGRLETCSNTMIFKTLPENNLPDQPAEPDDPADPEPDDPQLPSVEYEFSLPYHELVVNPSFNGGINFTTIGNVRFEAIVPEEYDWIWTEYAGMRNVHLYVMYNCTGADRSCEIVFRSLDHDCQHVLNVTQQHYEPIIINKSYKQDSFPLYTGYYGSDQGIAVTVDENGHAYILDWITVVTYFDYVKVQLAENNTSQTRMARIKLSSTPEQSLYFLYQTPKQ